MGLRTSTEIVSVKTAQAWLDGAAPNRMLDSGHVRELHREMVEGRFQARNGAQLVFDESGRLVDGQHRLHALIRFGRPLTFQILRGVSAADAATIDLNRRRTAGDVLSIREEPNAVVVAGGLRWIDLYYCTHWKEMRPKPNAREIVALLEKYPDVRVSVPLVHSEVGRRLYPSPSASIALHYVLSHVDAVAAKAFFEKLLSGQELREVDPVYRLRERLLQHVARMQRAKRMGTRALTDPRIYLSWAVQAWGACRQHRELKMLKLWDGSEPFPDVI